MSIGASFILFYFIFILFSDLPSFSRDLRGFYKW